MNSYALRIPPKLSRPNVRYLGFLIALLGGGGQNSANQQLKTLFPNPPSISSVVAFFLLIIDEIFRSWLISIS